MQRTTAISAFIILTALFVIGCFIRPLIPPDETRYLSVAWEMLVRHDFILPTINYAPYHHKPPMLFWLINGMWSIFGVAEWPARLMACLVSGAFMAMTYVVLRRLSPNLGWMSVLLLLASPIFIIYSTQIMFDALLGVAVLGAVYGVLRLSEGGKPRWWAFVGVMMGLGALIKGPVILVHILPLLLTMPLWMKGRERPHLGGWYLGSFLAVLIAFQIGFAWAIPAAIRGGAEYARMIFFGQTAGRMVKAFDHARPVYWYLPILLAYMSVPLMTKSFWGGLRSIIREGAWQEGERFAVRFLLYWAVPVFVLFSLISGKQLHYLLPVLPPIVGLSAMLIARFNPDSSGTYLMRMTVLSFLMVCVAVFVAQNRLAPYDLAPIGRAMQAMPEGTPMAVDEKYDGEYGFVGRLRQPLEVVPEPSELGKWLAMHPHGMIIHRFRVKEPHPLPNVKVLFEQDFKTSQKVELIQAP